MFKTLEIRNFQSHKNTKIDFSSGVNVITGSSNSGKTAILRSLNWIINNRPRGTSFIRRGQKKSEVVLFVGDNTVETGISRHRSDVDNCYSVATEKTSVEFEAIGSDVPREVSDIINFSEINIQEQLSPYFLVLDSPGKIALFLNSVTHLDEVDKIVRLLSSKVKGSEATLVRLKDSLSNLQVELDNITRLNLEEFEKNLRIATNIVECVNKIKIDVTLLDDIVIRLGATEADLDKIPVGIDQLIEEAGGLFDDHVEMRKRYDSLNTVLQELTVLKDRLVELPYSIDDLNNDATEVSNKHSDIAERYGTLSVILQELSVLEDTLVVLPYDIEDTMKEAAVVLGRYQDVTNNTSNLLSLYEEILEVEHAVVEVSDEERKHLKEIKQLYAEIDICPLCEQTLSDTAKEKILENYHG